MSRPAEQLCHGPWIHPRICVYYVITIMNFAHTVGVIHSCGLVVFCHPTSLSRVLFHITSNIVPPKFYNNMEIIGVNSAHYSVRKLFFFWYLQLLPRLRPYFAAKMRIAHSGERALGKQCFKNIIGDYFLSSVRRSFPHESVLW